MKKTKYILFAVLIISVLAITACDREDSAPTDNNDSNEPLLGGDTDEFGCKPSAGYTWCPSLNECVRVWETQCPEYAEYYREPGICTREYMPVTGDITIPTEDGEIIITKEFSNKCVAESAGAENIEPKDGWMNDEVIVTNFEECAEAGNPIMESFPEQCAHNGVVYTRQLSADEVEGFELKEACELLGGEYIDEHNECEYISEEACTTLGGEFKECESACRHDPDAEMCTMQCVIVCEFN